MSDATKPNLRDVWVRTAVCGNVLVTGVAGWQVTYGCLSLEDRHGMTLAAFASGQWLHFWLNGEDGTKLTARGLQGHRRAEDVAPSTGS